MIQVMQQIKLCTNAIYFLLRRGTLGGYRVLFPIIKVCIWGLYIYIYMCVYVYKTKDYYIKKREY